MVKTIKVQLHRPSRDVIVERARKLFDAAFGDDVNAHRACLYWAACTQFAAASVGQRLVIQAGSASFLRLPAHLDDGKPTTPTHFSYQWESPSEETIMQLAVTGRLPEMHVWTADPVRQEVVDLTTRHLRRQCQDLAGVPWLTPDPPDFIWSKLANLPEGWVYAPTREASLFAAQLITVDAMPEIVDAARRIL